MTEHRPHRNHRTTLAGLSVAATLTAGLVLGGCGGDAQAADVGARISDQFGKELRIEQDMDALVAKGSPGVVVAINEGDHITTMAMGIDDAVRIGSTTKTYTSVVALQLVAEGTLSLDDTVERWLPGMVPGGADVTLAQLLNHTSGIADYEVHPAYLAPYLAGDLGHVTPVEQLVGYANELGPRPVPPGTAAYSNTGYALTGLIIEQATGTSLATQLQQRIFDPLDLDATAYPTTPEMPEPHAHGYLVLGQPPAADVTDLSPTMAGPGGAIVATAADVARFYRALFGGELVDQDQLALMATALPGGGDGKHLGYGLQSTDLACGTVWGHTGNFPGYFVHAWSTLDGEHQAVVAMNIDPSSLGAAAEEITALVSDALCGPASDADTR
jgi:D-alanyl-D-alanine carboxypeptidase